MMSLDYSKKEVKGLIKKYLKLYNDKEKGHENTIVVLTDLENALKHITLTPPQKIVLRDVMFFGMDFNEIATEMKISRQAVDKHFEKIAIKVTNYLNEGVD